MAMAVGIVVKESKIHGKGVFAEHAFRKGETVLRWDTSHVLGWEDAELLPQEEKVYLSKKAGGKYLFLQPPERYVNHSCNPNTRVSGFSDVALRGIKKGEEITSDYGKESAPYCEFTCNCGAGNCRKFVKGEGK